MESPDRIPEGIEASETELRAIIDGVRDHAISLLDAEGRILTWNAAAERLKGWTLAEVKGQHIRMLFNEEDRAAGLPELEIEAARRDGRWQGEGFRLRKDGALFPAFVSLSALRDARRRVTGFVKVTEDVTERRRREAELQATKDQLEIILRGVADGLTVQEPGGKIIYANDVAVRTLGFSSASELMAAPIGELVRRFDVFDEAGRAVPREELPSALAHRGISPPERIVRLRSTMTGEDRWSVLRSAPSLDAEGRVQLVINFFRDITEQRRAEEALRDTEQRLVITLRSIGDAVIATDAAGRVSYMNPVAEALTGWPAAEADRRPLVDVFHIVNEQTRLPVESPVEKVLREGVIVGLANHTALLARDGTEVSIADSGAPIRGARGEVAGVVLVFRDVTAERHERERDRLLAEATDTLASSLDYEATVASVARLVVPAYADWCVIELVDDAGVLRPLEVAHRDPQKVSWARAVAERYPTDMRAETGSPQIVRTGRSELVAEIPAEILTASARDAEHLRLMREVGFTSYIGVPLTARGRVLGVLALISAESRRRYDAADLVFAEELGRRAALAIDNARLYREAQEANKLKDQFLATLSHELRTPLTAILGWARMLRTGRVPADRHERALETIERNGHAQARLIEDLLDISRINTGKLRLDLASIDPTHVVELAIDVVQPAADAKGTRIETALHGDVRAVLADADRLQQVVLNLLTNAVKFTPKGGRVQVRLRRDGAHVEIAVKDDGEGIAPEFLPYLFEQFRQADASQSRAHGGLGLGLAISRRLVEMHGGSIRAQSDGVGRGATFTIRLPSGSRPLERPAGSSSRGPETSATPRRVDLTGLRVLVVEDESDARELIAELLKDAGAAVEAAPSARAALDAVRRAPPDVIVSDIGMPVEDGYVLIRNVRALPPALGGRTPAIALTAYARAEDRTQALAAGFNSHVAKPVNPSELLVVVASLAGRFLPD